MQVQMCRSCLEKARAEHLSSPPPIVAGIDPLSESATVGSSAIDRATFERIRQRWSRNWPASWAVWGDRLDDLDVFDLKRNPALLRYLRNDVVMVGLNVSQLGVVVKPFQNFHGGGGGAYKIRRAFMNFPQLRDLFYGAYMTDFVKDVERLESEGVELSKSKAVMRYLNGHPIFVAECVAKLLDELNDLGCDRPTILAFGGDAAELIEKHIPHLHPIRLRHYSYGYHGFNSPEKWIQEVWQIVSRRLAV
jgi:hypothetical protein